MQRAQLGPPMVHMAKFHENRLKDLGARRVDDRHTDTPLLHMTFDLWLESHFPHTKARERQKGKSVHHRNTFFFLMALLVLNAERVVVWLLVGGEGDR